ncbi:hypothetical protein A2442_04000 [Candidatus Campbellbacteria bacterium RIFOXYC2_FULL_35_25]|uniref:Uncharacterized protein n=1 Tax=Candidatus Campbellbacteria bacterium RIFOXYC2_FULL_35_25 TaxID=1797582 RepID=A0A1F5EJY6_9BACT|nr:MAG: hypothetical protein A2442_04000 [Candidatus Campbellbacteria bacterium RIFOXYC2_FULL_35_25]
MQQEQGTTPALKERFSLEATSVTGIKLKLDPHSCEKYGFNHGASVRYMRCTFGKIMGEDIHGQLWVAADKDSGKVRLCRNPSQLKIAYRSQ